MGVFGAGPCGPVVRVTQMPSGPGCDGLLALGAVDVACCDLGFPLFAECDVLGPVASLASAASCSLCFGLVRGAEATCCDEGAACLGTDAFGSWHYLSQMIAAVLISRWMVLSAMIMSQTDSHAGVSPG